MADARTPCQVDRLTTGKEWADEVAYRTRAEIQWMATQCGRCPLIRACHQTADKLEAENPGSVAGIWGGLFRRDGLTIDPWGPDHDDFKSVYRYVWYDSARESWRADKVKDKRRYYLAVSASEDEAGAASWDWILEHEG